MIVCVRVYKMSHPPTLPIRPGVYLLRPLLGKNVPPTVDPRLGGVASRRRPLGADWGQRRKAWHWPRVGPRDSNVLRCDIKCDVSIDRSTEAPFVSLNQRPYHRPFKQAGAPRRASRQRSRDRAFDCSPPLGTQCIPSHEMAPTTHPCWPQARRRLPAAAATAATLGCCLLLALLLPSATADATTTYPFAPEPFECDVPRETRTMISLRALEILRRNGFEHVETGFYASHVRMWVWGCGAVGGCGWVGECFFL